MEKITSKYTGWSITMIRLITIKWFTGRGRNIITNVSRQFCWTQTVCFKNATVVMMM